MKRNLKQKLAIYGLSAGMLVGPTSCEALLENPELLQGLINEFFNVGFGWYGATDNFEEIPDDISFGYGSGEMPSSVDLMDKFPPVESQGQYGTCVAWAVGYNLRTHLYGVREGLSTSQLASASNQFSPKDLFWAVPEDLKGEDCNGTGFEPAFDVMVERGIAKMSTVPYESLGDCSDSPSSSWTSDAGNYRIDSYRQVSGTDVDELKAYLAQGRPMAIGCKLGDNFMGWNSSDVLDYDTDTYNGQHAYHAMVLVGYDDNKGANGAFRILNSWGDEWGDNGLIWIDYDFFTGGFCFAAFVGSDGNAAPDDQTTTGYDLAAWNVTDVPSSGERFIYYNTYNTGDETITASQDWDIMYLVYNVDDPEDYQILIYDYYTDDYGSYGEYGLLESGDPNAYGLSKNWWNNIDVAPGEGVAEALVGAEEFSYPYSLPSSLNGNYYFLLLADGFNRIAEVNEDNNYFFLMADDDGTPFQIQNGVVLNDPAKAFAMQGFPDKPAQKYAASPSPTVRRPGNMNAYSGWEIRAMLENQRASGELQARVEQFIGQQKVDKTATK